METPVPVIALGSAWIVLGSTDIVAGILVLRHSSLDRALAVWYAYDTHKWHVEPKTF
jgi:hypothetical protein